MTTLPCVECGDPVGIPNAAVAPIHAVCLDRLIRRLADLKTAVAVAREERDRAEQDAKAAVQVEMASLRKRLARLRRPAED